MEDLNKFNDIRERLQLLTVEDLVDLGVGSRASCYRLIASGSLPCVRRGRSVRVRAVDLERWMEQGGAVANVVPFHRRRTTARKSA
jgi:excisionase family DNA binding protein